MRKNVDIKFMKEFGSNLKKIRLAKHITQAQLAIDCEVDVSVISRIERGVVNTCLSNINTIAKALAIEPKELFDF